MKKEIWNNVYVNGLKEGVHKKFLFDGRKDCIGTYKNNLHHGECMSLTDEGNLRTRVFFKNDLHFGQYKNYRHPEDKNYGFMTSY